MRETENRWRISLTSTLTKGYFRDLGIPRPSEATFLDYSEIVPQSQGGESKQGYQNITLVWERLNRNQLYQLELFRANAIAGLLYFTIEKANGESPGVDWIDCSGTPGVIQFANEPKSRGNVKTGVQWVVRAITVLNDPASF